jgi:hypothetical protein
LRKLRMKSLDDVSHPKSHAGDAARIRVRE